MKLNTRIFIDLDGVVANWEKRAAQYLGVEEIQIGKELKGGADIEKFYPQLRDIILEAGREFWEGIDPLPWAEELYNLAQNYGEVAFLTSGGNFKRNSQFVADANAGKVYWVALNFPQSQLILAREKWLCASENSILIDDTKNKITKFIQYGGQGFHWPHPYIIKDEEYPIKQVLGDLESKLIEMNQNLPRLQLVSNS